MVVARYRHGAPDNAADTSGGTGSGRTVGPTAVCKLRGPPPDNRSAWCRYLPNCAAPAATPSRPSGPRVMSRMCASSPDHTAPPTTTSSAWTAAAAGCGLTSRQDLTTKTSGLTTAP